MNTLTKTASSKTKTDKTANQTANQTANPSRYFVRGREGDWIEVKGRPVIIPGYEEFMFFIHRPINQAGEQMDKYWTVTEARSGLWISGESTRVEAIIRAGEILNRRTVETLQEHIEKAVAKSGESPAFAGNRANAPNSEGK